jgi:hypothetical protein
MTNSAHVSVNDWTHHRKMIGLTEEQHQVKSRELPEPLWADRMCPVLPDQTHPTSGHSPPRALLSLSLPHRMQNSNHHASGHLLHRASGQPCLSFSRRGQIPNASDRNSGRVQSRLKLTVKSNTEHIQSLCRTRLVSPRPALSTCFSTPLFLCANTKVSHHLCTSVSIFHKLFQGLIVSTLGPNAYT